MPRNRIDSVRFKISRRVPFIAAACLLLLPFSRAGAGMVDRLEAGEPQTIVVYGTSLTAGGAWSGQLKKALEVSYPGLVTLVNSGGSGMTSEWGVENLRRKVLEQAPDVVFVEFSVNDATARFDLSLEQSRANLNAMIDGILNLNPTPEIILQVMSPVIDRPEGHAGWRPRLAEYQQIYRDVAAERGLLLIDHMPTWNRLLEEEGEEAFRKLTRNRDGLHPNAEGYRRFVTPTILKALGAPMPPHSGE